MDPILLTRQQVRNISAFLQNLDGAPEELITLWSAITRNESQGTPLLLTYSQTDATHDDPLPPSFLTMPLRTLAPPNQMMPLGLLPESQGATQQPISTDGVIREPVPDVNCPRGGRRMRRNQSGWQRRQNPRIKGSASMEAIVGVLGAAHLKSESYDPVAWAQDIADIVHERGSLEEGSFAQLIARCALTTRLNVVHDFLRMLGLVQLVATCQSMRAGTAYTLRDIYDNHVVPLGCAHLSARTFTDWIQSGTKFAVLAAGGTVYILIMIAGLELRTTVSSMVGDSAWQLGNALRHPNPDTAVGATILERIVPMVNTLRRLLPLSMSSMFSPSLLAHHRLPSNIDCTSLSASDAFLDSIIFNTFSLIPRCQDVWDDDNTSTSGSELGTLSALYQQHLEAPSSGPRSSSLITSTIPSAAAGTSTTQAQLQTLTSSVLIQTTYNRLDCQNRKMPTPQSREADLVWTEEQRRYADDAPTVNSVDELSSTLQNLYVDGKKSPPEAYVRIPNSLIRSRQLELRNEDGTLMAYICGTMPQSLRTSLLQRLLLAFEDENMLINKDTKQDADNSFQALHFSWYNRHATRGDDAPINTHPYMMEKRGVRTNHSQLVPYISAETAANEDLYELITVIFRDLFDWIQKNLQEYLPEEYVSLEATARILPGNHQSPVLPFLSLVFNVNVITKGHRDGKDKDFCLVLPIGDFVGGELVAMETGLVVEILQGDFMVFPSAFVTHFNLHYQGRRASMVLHTDKAMDDWAIGRNGWEENITFASF